MRKDFGELDSLKTLRLNYSSTLTDQGIQGLVNSKSLQRLEVAWTGVTREAAQRLNRTRGKGKSIIIQGHYWTEPHQE